MVNITINIDAKLHQKLKDKSKENFRSLRSEVVYILNNNMNIDNRDMLNSIIVDNNNIDTKLKQSNLFINS